MFIASAGRTNVWREVMLLYQQNKLPTEWVLEDLVKACEIRYQQDMYAATQTQALVGLIPQLAKAANSLGNSRGASPVRPAADRGRSPTHASAFATTATPGPDNCRLHPSGGPKGYHTNAQCRGSRSPSPRRSYTPSPGPSPRVAVVSSTTPPASALKATQRITERVAAEVLTGAEAGGASSMAEVVAAVGAGSLVITIMGSNSSVATCEVVGMHNTRTCSLLIRQAGRQA